MLVYIMSPAVPPYHVPCAKSRIAIIFPDKVHHGGQGIIRILFRNKNENNGTNKCPLKCLGGVIVICVYCGPAESLTSDIYLRHSIFISVRMVWPRRWWKVERQSSSKMNGKFLWRKSLSLSHQGQGEAEIKWQGLVMSIADTLTLQGWLQRITIYCRLQMFINSFVDNYNYRKGQGWGEGQPLMVVSDKWIKIQRQYRDLIITCPPVTATQSSFAAVEAKYSVYLQS